MTVASLILSMRRGLEKRSAMELSGATAATASQTAGRPLVLDGGSKLSASLKTFSRALAGIPEPESRERSGLFGRIGRPVPAKS